MNFESYQNIIEEPLSSEWPCGIWSPKDTALQALRRSARRRLVTSARMYSEHLSTLAVNANGDDVGTHELLDGDPNTVPMVMTGHQPVIFHSGLTYKYGLTEQFARRHQAIGIAVVIDTDEGDAGEFACPANENHSEDGNLVLDARSRMRWLTTKRFSFAKASGLYANSKRRSEDEIAQLCQSVLNDLQQCNCIHAADAFRNAADMYRRLQGCSMLETNLIARRAAGVGGRLLEVRLSELCGLPECLQFFANLLSRPFSYARRCNEVLAKFRAAHGIRNQANPFPDLKVNEHECELPFWLVNLSEGTRSIARVRRVDGVPTLCGEGLSVELIPGHEAAALFALSIGQTPLVPRGALITATMRLLFSDVFVHGTGGGRYDQFTDELIEAWWNETPSPLTVASASRYLFDEERTELDRLEQLVNRQRDLQFNPQRSLGTGVFPRVLEDALRRLLGEKDGRVKALQQARSAGESAEEIGRDIQKITDQIRSIVASEFDSQLALFRNIPQAAIDTVRSRTWPWFFFSQ